MNNEEMTKEEKEIMKKFLSTLPKQKGLFIHHFFDAYKKRSREARTNEDWLNDFCDDVFNYNEKNNEKTKQEIERLEKENAQLKADLKGSIKLNAKITRDYWIDKEVNEKLQQELKKKDQIIEKAEKVIEFYAGPYVVDEGFAVNEKGDLDDDCESDPYKPWLYYTGKRARQYFEDKQKQRGER